MNELTRFCDPWDAYGLHSWRKSGRLIERLKKTTRRNTIPWRRGFLILRELFGEEMDVLDPMDLSYGYQRLLVLDWVTGFKVLGFFTEAEIREYALLSAPPQDSILGHFWYGLLAGETPANIERQFRLKKKEKAS